MDGKMRLATFALALLLAGLPAHAEVIRDGSIGPLVPIGADGVPDGLVPGGTDPLGQAATYLISADLGKQVAGNLFHSFYEFGLDSSAEVATFTGPDSVVNVIGRVTGPLRSEIFGTIRSTIDGADLFLLNPRGVFFGQTAVLDVPGSFYTSTAGRLRFAEGPDFDTTAAIRDDSALSWAAPTAFGFLGEPAAVNCCAVVIQAPESLTVPAGETLTVVGSNQSDASLIYSGVRVIGNVNTFATIRAPGARVQLASAAGEVDIPLDLRDLDPEAVDDGALGRLFLAADARIDVGGFAEGEAAGTILIRGGKFIMGGRASLTAVHRGEAAAPTAIDVAVSDELQITGSGTSVFSSTRAAGRGGDVSLTGDRVIVDQALVQSETEGAGRGGDVLLNARSVGVDRGGQISSVSRPGAGRGGDVHIGGIEDPRAQSVEIEGGGNLVSQTTGSSPGGEIRVDAESLILSGGGAIESLAQGTDATAVGGTIDIDATRVEVANLGSRISSVTQSPATGGQLRVDTGPAGVVAVSDAGQVITRSDGPGAGGAARIATRSLEVTDEGRVQTVAQSDGPGGALAIEAQSVLVSNATNRAQSSLISSLTLGEGPDGCCRGGDLTIRTDSLEVVDGGQIQSITEGSGDAGRLEILEAQLVGVRGQNDLENGGAAIVSRVKEGATGSGGFLSIGTQILEVENGAFITSDTRSLGDAGGLEIGLEGAPAERVTVRGGAEGLGQVSAASIGGSADLDVGEAGDLTIRTDTLELLDGGQVSSSTSSAGDAGDVRIAARSVTVSGVDPENPANQSGVFAQSNTDRVGTGALAGVVEISAEELTVSDRGTISVSTDGAGDAGAIVIDADRSVRIEGDGNVRAQTRALSTGGGGSIDITTRGSVELFDGGRISAESRGSGDAGDIYVGASESVALTEGSSISAETAEEGAGGSIAVVADSVELSGGASVTARTEGTGGGGSVEIGVGGGVRSVALSGGSSINAESTAVGDAGDIYVGASESVALTGHSSISAETTGAGGGGAIAIAADSVELSGGASVTARTEGTGGGGSIAIGVRSAALSGRSSIGVESRGSGNAGDIHIVASDSVALAEHSSINAESAGSGDAGDIGIGAGESVTLTEGSSLTAETAGDGSGGSIAIAAADSVELSDGASVTARTEGAGRGGSIEIGAGGLVDLAGGARISAESGGSGEAGDIHVTARSLSLTGGSEITTNAEEASGGTIEIDVAESVAVVDSAITTSVFGAGGGGDIIIDPQFVLLNRSSIEANSKEGRGGLISISAGLFLKSADSVVQAKAPPGLEGDVEISGPETDLTGKLESLSQSFLDASALLGGACGARTGRAGSFVVQRWAALPPPPDVDLSLAATAPAVAAGGLECPLGEVTP